MEVKSLCSALVDSSMENGAVEATADDTNLDGVEDELLNGGFCINEGEPEIKANELLDCKEMPPMIKNSMCSIVFLDEEF